MRRASLALAALAAACAPSPPPPPQVAPPPAPEPGVEAAAAPVVWRYHPSSMASVFGTLRLDDGRRLLVGDRGERWLTDVVPAEPSDPDSAELRSVALESTPYRAPEALSSAARLGSDRWLFVGQSGTLYTAKTPLGPFAQALRAREPLPRVVGAGSALVALTSDGRVLRNEEGRAWSEARVGARLFDVAADARGNLLGLSIPEALYLSRDRGVSWTPLANAPHLGAGQLFVATEGGFGIAGVVDTVRYDPEAATFTPGATQPSGPAEDNVSYLPRRGPSTAAIDEKRAVLTGERYYEIRRDDDGSWRLLAGHVRATVETLPTSGFADCYGMRLGASGKHVLVSCAKTDEKSGEPVVELWHSGDEGRTFRHAVDVQAPDPEALGLALAPDGSALVGNACVQGDASCSGSLLHVTPAGRVTEIRTADLMQPPTGVAFSADGHGAYFFGRRTKDSRYGLYVSDDGGLSFESRPLPAPTPSDDPSAVYWDLESEVPRAVCPGEDGELGVLLQVDPPVYALADRDGQVGNVVRLPDETLAAHCHGRYVLALTGSSSEYPVQLKAWESQDGGATFVEAHSPLGLTVDELEEPLAVRCSAGACVVAGRATRAGWGESGESYPRLAPPETEVTTEPAARSPISCTLDDKAGWTLLSDVQRNASGDALPTAADAMRGDSAWSVLHYSRQTGELTATSMGQDGKLLRERLFAPTADPKSMAYGVSPQLEGYAAVRVRLGRALPGELGKPTGRVELAWVNYMEGKVGRGALDATGLVDVGDVHPDYDGYGATANPPATLERALLSVSPGGVYYRPSHASPKTYFVDLAGKHGDPVSYPDWPATPYDTAGDAVWVDGKHVAVARLGQDQATALAPLDGSGVAQFFRTAPAPDGVLTTARWTYEGGRVGLAVHVSDPSYERPWAYFAPFRGDATFGAPVALPTQEELGDAPRFCTADERKATPRLVAPYAAGTRHPVVVVGTAGDPTEYHLLTDGAVLHGTPTAPCVAAFDALQLGSEPTVVRLVLRGDLAQAWLFRPVTDAPDAIEWRPASCRYNPSVPVPAELWREPGTTRTQR
ncbi:MAG: hypothetical protein HY908_22040 [Myxococcales bacterium]|nr:hypothetical protein [Myxococcales bacterium]